MRSPWGQGVSTLRTGVPSAAGGKGTPTPPREEAVVTAGGAGESRGRFTQSAQSRAMLEV